MNKNTSCLCEIGEKTAMRDHGLSCRVLKRHLHLRRALQVVGAVSHEGSVTELHVEAVSPTAGPEADSLRQQKETLESGGGSVRWQYCSELHVHSWGGLLLNITASRHALECRGFVWKHTSIPLIIDRLQPWKVSPAENTIATNGLLITDLADYMDTCSEDFLLKCMSLAILLTKESS
jgi:hypothetical protein